MKALAQMTTEADKAYMMAGAIPPRHLAEIQKNGTPYKGQTRRELIAENRRLQERLESGKDTTTTTTAKEPAKLTRKYSSGLTPEQKQSHAKKVRAEKMSSLNALLESKKKRREAKELADAKTLGDKLAFRQEIGADAKAHEARNKALDAEADRLEAAARGETVTTAPAKSATVTKSKSVYDQYLAIKSGPERKAFLKANHAAIMHAVNTKEGNQ